MAELEEFANAVAFRTSPLLQSNVNPTNIAQLKNLDARCQTSREAQLLSPAAYSQWMPANNRNETQGTRLPRKFSRWNQIS